MLNYTLGTIEASEALIKDLYIEAKYPVITGFLSQSVGIMQK